MYIHNPPPPYIIFNKEKNVKALYKSTKYYFLYKTIDNIEI